MFNRYPSISGSIKRLAFYRFVIATIIARLLLAVILGKGQVEITRLKNGKYRSVRYLRESGGLVHQLTIRASGPSRSRSRRSGMMHTEEVDSTSTEIPF